MHHLRIRRRVHTLSYFGKGYIENHSLKFHKKGSDGSAKANAFHIPKSNDFIWGIIWEIDTESKSELDKHEGLGKGYNEKRITVILDDQYSTVEAIIYIADEKYIDDTMKPYHWYKSYVFKGGIQNYLPKLYMDKIAGIPSGRDLDEHRRNENWKVLNQSDSE